MLCVTRKRKARVYDTRRGKFKTRDHSTGSVRQTELNAEGVR